METEYFLDLLERGWDRAKKFTKYTIESNFTCMDDYIFFGVFFSLVGAVIVLAFLIGYSSGYNAGDIEGARRGWAGATTFNAP